MCPSQGEWAVSQSEKKEVCATLEERKWLCGPREGACPTAKPSSTAQDNILGPPKLETVNIVITCNSGYSKSMLYHHLAFWTYLQRESVCTGKAETFCSFKAINWYCGFKTLVSFESGSQHSQVQGQDHHSKTAWLMGRSWSTVNLLRKILLCKALSWWPTILAQAIFIGNSLSHPLHWIPFFFFFRLLQG